MKTPTFGLFDHIEGIPGTRPPRSSRIGWTSSARPTRPGSGASTSPSTTARTSRWRRTRTSSSRRRPRSPRTSASARWSSCCRCITRCRSSRTCASWTTSPRAAWTTASAAARSRWSTRGTAATSAGARALRRLPRDHRRGAAQRRGLQREQRVPRLPADAADDRAAPGSDPVLVPGQPVDGGPLRHEPHVARPDLAGGLRGLPRGVGEVQGRAHPPGRPELRAERRHHDDGRAAPRTRTRRSRSPGAAWTGLQRRTFARHRFDALIIDEDEQEAALGAAQGDPGRSRGRDRLRRRHAVPDRRAHGRASSSRGSSTTSCSWCRRAT